MARHPEYRNYLLKRKIAKTQVRNRKTAKSYAKEIFQWGGGLSATLSLEILAEKYLSNNPIALFFIIVLVFSMLGSALILLSNLFTSFRIKRRTIFVALVVSTLYGVVVTIAVLARPLLESLISVFY
ncbi:hypothetical protein RIE95_09725 [Acidithiobacillus thiooxidans]|uniref:hypothetical protein n=1 Tax=Acidithiobacillus thiooxidans TaxID=930 RepID=UPI00285AEF9F|nr:hypothetical protein [Acidithiobacillus thiooxidans]MDR7927257.1 hypothetical protein [Acidithiobacillus thiooxidans]